MIKTLLLHIYKCETKITWIKQAAILEYIYEIYLKKMKKKLSSRNGHEQYNPFGDNIRIRARKSGLCGMIELDLEIFLEN